MLKVEGLTKNYGEKTVLNAVSFQVKRGEIVGLVGENGAGKSTLLHLLATIQKPTTGKIILNKRLYHPTNLKAFRKEIGFVPQEIAIWEQFTVEENMMFFLFFGFYNSLPIYLNKRFKMNVVERKHRIVNYQLRLFENILAKRFVLLVSVKKINLLRHAK